MRSSTDEFALGVDYENQKIKLQKMYRLFQTMKFVGGGTKKFHIGGMMTINATLALYETLKSKYNIPNLKVSHLNQCYTERFFGDVRAMGGADNNPCALHILYRVQWQIIKQFLNVSHL